jgi:hypothetical protein
MKVAVIGGSSPEPAFYSSKPDSMTLSIPTMKTAVTWDSTKTHHTVDRSPRDHHPRQRSWHYPGWADFTTATNGGKLRKAVFVARVALLRSSTNAVAIT